MTPKASSRIFYGVELLSPELSAALDAIRFLAEPGYYRHSHITVRGPYQRSLNSNELKAINSKFEPKFRFVEITHSGTFFLGNQNTVLLHCEIPGIRDVWNKPNYSDGVPHVTLYDGKSRKDAMALSYVIKKFNWSINSKVSEIKRLSSKIDPIEDFIHIIHESVSLREAVFKEIDLQEVAKRPLLDRMVFIELICRFVEQNFANKRFGKEIGKK